MVHGIIQDSCISDVNSFPSKHFPLPVSSQSDSQSGSGVIMAASSPKDTGLSGQFSECNDSPREVDFLSEEHIEELLDIIDSLRGKTEHLQIHCEKLALEKAGLEDKLIAKERDEQKRISDYERTISELRELNTKLAAKQDDEKSSKVPVWVKTAVDAEHALREKAEAEDKARSLEIKLMEKDKLISNLEWQLMDVESTVVSLQGERDRLAVELDCMLAREQDHFETYGMASVDRGVFSDVDDEDIEEPCQKSEKHPRRHLSDLSRHGDSKVDDLSSLVQHKSKSNASSDMDMFATAEFGLGGLKRTTNFNNINDVDETVDFHEERHTSFANSNITDLSASFPVPKKPLVSSSWQSFGSDSECDWREGSLRSDRACGVTEQAVSMLQLSTAEEAFEDALDTDWTLDGRKAGNQGASCRSSSSAYFSDSAPEISQDLFSFTPDSIINVSTGEVLHSPSPASPESIRKAFEAENAKDGNADDWGEVKTPTNQLPESELKSELGRLQDTDPIDTARPVKLPSSQVDMKSSDNLMSHDVQFFTPSTFPDDKNSSKQELLKETAVSVSLQTHLAPVVPVTPQSDTRAVELLTPQQEMTSPDMTSNWLPPSTTLERTISMRSDSVVDTFNRDAVNHQRMGSMPIVKSADQKNGTTGANPKLDAYQRWKLSGRVGQPPAKLKISQ
ncbi:predicted protein [Nematostella vectensis]|uniref:Uncharacterized protein n=1 Tax=Nematostella vectensis TaxID=45351 RepID=A7RQ91_NEMVE|nr:predicted protein [Nematostella vectensis]|eukprot:XP_001638381.1 predicted protein [Nematostella vectensis]